MYTFISFRIFLFFFIVIFVSFLSCLSVLLRVSAYIIWHKYAQSNWAFHSAINSFHVRTIDFLVCLRLTIGHIDVCLNITLKFTTHLTLILIHWNGCYCLNWYYCYYWYFLSLVLCVVVRTFRMHRDPLCKIVNRHLAVQTHRLEFKQNI